MMKTKFSLLIFALLFVCSGMMAQDKIKSKGGLQET